MATQKLGKGPGVTFKDSYDYQDELRNMLTRHIWEFLQVTPGPFPDFLGGAWGQG